MLEIWVKQNSYIRKKNIFPYTYAHVFLGEQPNINISNCLYAS